MTTEKRIKNAIRRTERKFGIQKGLLEAVAWVEYAKKYGWTDSHLNEVHPDGTSFGLFGLRESTSVREYTDRVGNPDERSIEGQAEIAGWYLGKRVPQMIRHYKKPVNLETLITGYNAGISRVISGELPSDTKTYIQLVRDYLGEKKSLIIPLLSVLVLIFGIKSAM